MACVVADLLAGSFIDFIRPPSVPLLASDREGEREGGGKVRDASTASRRALSLSSIVSEGSVISVMLDFKLLPFLKIV